MDRRNFLGALAGLPLVSTIQPKPPQVAKAAPVASQPPIAAVTARADNGLNQVLLTEPREDTLVCGSGSITKVNAWINGHNVEVIYDPPLPIKPNQRVHVDLTGDKPSVIIS